MYTDAVDYMSNAPYVISCRQLHYRSESPLIDSYCRRERQL